VFSRRRLASTERTMFLRWFPPELGSPGRVAIVYFVAITRLSRFSAANSPSSRSEVPLV
jgi:hypothetical protein